VHHSSTRASLSKRLFRPLIGFLAPARSGMRHRAGRLALGAVVSTVLTALVLSVPVVSGAGGGTPLVALDSFAASSAARTTDAGSPVVMGRDGRPVSSSTFAGLSTAPGARGSSTDAFAAPPAVPTPEAAPAPVETAPPAAPAPETAEEAPSAPPVVEEAPAPPPAPAPAAVPADLGAEDQVLALVNIERAAAGCGALSGDAALASVARAHSADMRDRGFFSHTNPDGLDPFARAAQAGLDARAENIAYGQPDPAAVMVAWMNSPGHRANILDCSLTRLGVGMAEGPGGPWWTQLFA
jgi:uncharacterized protein YkwD